MRKDFMIEKESSFHMLLCTADNLGRRLCERVGNKNRAFVGHLEASIPSPVGAMHFSVPTSARKLCEHFQKCAISPVKDRPSLVKGLTWSISATLKCIA